MRSLKLHTVCEEAACPNLAECWKQKHATFMILGAICTRACAFCNVATGKPLAVDADETAHVAEAVSQLGLHHVVITSVDRHALEDGGDSQFVRTSAEITKASPGPTLALLTPHFNRPPG